MDGITYRLELITSLSMLESHKAEYEKFCSYLPASEKFTYCLDWVMTHYPLYTQHGVELFWIIFWDNNNIIAVAPFQKESLNVSRLGLRRLRIWGDNNHYVHNTQPTILIKDKNVVDNVLSQLLTYLNTDLKSQWDELFLHRIKDANTTLKRLLTLDQSMKTESSSDATYYFSAPSHIEDIIRGESKRKIKKGLEKLKEKYSSVSLNCFTDISNDKYSQIVDLHTKRQFSANQQGAERNSFFNHPLESKTIEKEIKIASQKKALRLYTLEIDHQVIAFLLCFHEGDWTYAHITAFDDKYKHFKAARVLWFHAFTEERKKYGCHLIDTGWGGNQFKQAFSNKTENLYAIRMNNNNSLRSKLITQSLNAPRAFKKLIQKAS
ncbi:MAG: GNAT family N-acetyltransferase [Cellvibrionaceae bacterium]